MPKAYKNYEKKNLRRKIQINFPIFLYSVEQVKKNMDSKAQKEVIKL